MKNKRRIHQKIKNKRNKRNKRQGTSNIPSFSPFVGYKPNGYNTNKIKYGKMSLKELEKIPSAMSRHQKKTDEEQEIVQNTCLTFQGMIDTFNKSETEQSEMRKQGKNESGFPMVELDVASPEILEDLDSPPPQNVTLGDIKEINDLRMKTPNGNLITYPIYFIKDSYFEGRDLEDEIKVRIRMLTNSQYLGLNEKDGFTEELLNDAKEMEKYMCNCVRIIFDDELDDGGFVDCPLDDYKRIIMDKNPPQIKHSLPLVRRTLLRTMDEFDNQHEVLKNNGLGDDEGSFNKLIQLFTYCFYSIMDSSYFDVFERIMNEKESSKRIGFLLVVKECYQKKYDELIKNEPEKIKGFNYLYTHEWKYNKKTKDLEFEGKGVEGVTFDHNRKHFHQYLDEKVEKQETDNYVKV